jgi:FkbM family methyltransferase
MAVRMHNNDPMSRNIRTRGFWEIQAPQELADLADTTLPPPDDYPRYLLDIGANIGFYTLLFAHFRWHVIAIEPMPSNLRALNISLCLNPRLARRVTIVPAALTVPEDAGGMCIIRADNKRFGNGGIGNGKLNCGRNDFPEGPCVSNEQSRCEVVATRTLDSVLKEVQPPRIDVVKVDVEGQECAAMASNGSAELYVHWRPQLIQWEGKQPEVDKCMRRHMKQLGYHIGNHFGNDRNTVAKSVGYHPKTQK